MKCFTTVSDLEIGLHTQFIGEILDVKVDGAALNDKGLPDMDITGNEAIVKVEDLYLGLRFTDYLSLLLIDNSWVIVNKVYYYPH